MGWLPLWLIALPLAFLWLFGGDCEKAKDRRDGE